MFSRKGIQYTPIIKSLLFFAVAATIICTLIFTVTLFMPDADEYDNPDTITNETFPWNPNILTNGKDVLNLLFMSTLRHLALLPQHIQSKPLITLVGYVFTTMLLYRVRRAFLHSLSKKEPIGLDEYVQWGFGSIISAIIFLAGSTQIEITSKGFAIFLLSVSALVIYLIHPDVCLWSAIKNRLYPRIPCPSCNKRILLDSKFCSYCGKELETS